MGRNGLWTGALVALALGLAACGTVTKPDQTGVGGGAGGAASCNLAAPFGAPVPIADLNSPQLDDGLSFSSDDQVAWFTSTRSGGVGGRDIWTATRTSTEAFATPTLVGVVNSTADDEVPRVTADGLTLLFGSARNAARGYDIMVATRTSVLASFLTPAPLDGVNSEADDSDAYRTVDGKTLYFASKRAGGEFDIYVATANVAGVFGQPTSLPAIVNTTAKEATPVASRDELRLYFARWGADRAYDIYVAQRASVTAPFDDVSLVSEVSSASEDFPVEISADGCTLYLVSNRPGGQGDRDIYVARRGN